MTPFRKGSGKRKFGKGRDAERKTIKRFQGRGMPASGAMEGAKGDFALDKFLVENKSTVHESYKLTRDVLCKINGEARRGGKMPALAVQFVDGSGNPKKQGAYVVIPEWVFQSMIDEDV